MVAGLRLTTSPPTVATNFSAKPCARTKTLPLVYEMSWANASCASLKFPGTLSATDIPLPDMDNYLAEMDTGMGEISHFDFIEAAPGKAHTQELDEANHFARNAVKSLYVTAMFSDLPPEGQSHPGMQKRMMLALPEIEKAAREMDQYFSTHSADDNARLQEFLLQPEDPGLQFLEKFNNTAADLGICQDRRLQTRAMMTRLLWRLKRQSPELLFHEYSSKAEKLQASSGVEDAARLHMATKASEEAFWHWQQQQSAVQTSVGTDSEPQPPKTDPEKQDEAGESDLEEYKNWAEFTETEEESEIDQKTNAQKGARLMGIGFGIFAVSGALLYAGAVPFVFAMTVGAVIFLVGLLRLLGGLISGT